MKELTQEEFDDRAAAIQRARRIFLDTGMTNNITVAFEAYQAIFAERTREIHISGNRYGTKTIMDKYERPQCPDCNSDMNFRQVPPNPDGVKIQLVCSRCDTVLNSENDLQWWMRNLGKKS